MLGLFCLVNVNIFHESTVILSQKKKTVKKTLKRYFLTFKVSEIFF